jgi:hypothetical protein
LRLREHTTDQFVDQFVPIDTLGESGPHDRILEQRVGQIEVQVLGGGPAPRFECHALGRQRAQPIRQ